MSIHEYMGVGEIDRAAEAMFVIYAQNALGKDLSWHGLSRFERDQWMKVAEGAFEAFEGAFTSTVEELQGRIDELEAVIDAQE